MAYRETYGGMIDQKLPSLSECLQLDRAQLGRTPVNQQLARPNSWVVSYGGWSSMSMLADHLRMRVHVKICLI